MNRRQLLLGLAALPVAGAAATLASGDGVALKARAHPIGPAVPEYDFWARYPEVIGYRWVRSDDGVFTALPLRFDEVYSA